MMYCCRGHGYCRGPCRNKFTGGGGLLGRNLCVDGAGRTVGCSCGGWSGVGVFAASGFGSCVVASSGAVAVGSGGFTVAAGSGSAVAVAAESSGGSFCSGDIAGGFTGAGVGDTSLLSWESESSTSWT